MSITLLGLLAACGDDKKSDTFQTGKYEASGTPGFIEFKSDRGFVVTNTDGTTADVGTYSIDGSTLTFETDEYCATFDAATANYEWKLDGATLTLTLKGDDQCSARSEFLDGPLTKS